MTDREHALLPYQATSLRGERLLVLAPHPDDEVIGCGGLIALHTDERRQVVVVVVSDGAQGVDGELVTEREEECRAGLRRLGVLQEPRFLRFPDRRLSEHRTEIAAALEAILLDFDPDLIAVPSPIEVHPDHVALCRTFLDVVEKPDARRSNALTRVAFYEVSQPMQPNTLVDISNVAARKQEAIRCHASQMKARDYAAFAAGLNTYRALTLDPSITQAEAYWVTALGDAQLYPADHFARSAAPAAMVESSSETLPISVLVRTRNRPALLRQALASIQQNRYPAEVIVVNDGGVSPADAIAGGSAVLVDLETSVGRSEALNLALRKATHSFIAFLDDDDLFYSDHLATLSRAAQHSTSRAFYSDAVSVFFERSDHGDFAEKSRHRLFSEDYDPDLLMVDNYIPLLTLLVRRDDALEVGGFDPSFDLFEDWDFLLRLTRKTPLVHLRRLTCEVRHYPTGESLAMQAGAELERMREGKKKIWTRHRERLTDDVLTAAIEKRKQRLATSEERSSAAAGRARHLQLDVERLSREKELLINELRSASERGSRIELEYHAVAEHARQLEQARASAEKRAAELEVHRDLLSREHQEKSETMKLLYDEIERLNALLTSIYGSRTWKMHEMVERMKRRN